MGDADTFPFFELSSDTGATLAVYAREAAAPARGVVHINHGLAEHAGRYARFAAFLNERGYHVFAHDHRGHGRTTAPDAPPRTFAKRQGWDAVLNDVAAVNAAARARHPGLPVVTFGHSMGGTVALTYAARRPETVDALAVWNAQTQAGPEVAAARLVLGLERLRGGRDAPARLMNALSFEAWNRKLAPNRTDFDWLSRDEAEVDAYVADPDCGWTASVSLWRDLFDGLREAGERSTLARLPASLPVHLLGGANDPVTAGGRAVRALAGRLRRAGLGDVTDDVLDDVRHETLNELGREAAMTAFATWLDRVTAR